MRVGPSIGRSPTPATAKGSALVGGFVTLKVIKWSVVARSMAEAEYRADEKAPGPDGTIDFSKIPHAGTATFFSLGSLPPQPSPHVSRPSFSLGPAVASPFPPPPSRLFTSETPHLDPYP
ncbi:hypothetical protein Salat_1378500 [Sesamum alatum]|uniref:Uncharacterized protein n=1 Tax=Sesamum alatum TaxID=300844 RepID=A0AAE1Y995_9LAMI|nr:hypothetical protein Salat_1378500 [Sesamum alatum]